MIRRKTVKIDKKLIKMLKNAKISAITERIDKVKEGSVFVCIKGRNFNSHALVNEAFKRKATFVVGEEINLTENYIRVKNSRKALAYLLNIFYKFPDRKMNLIGVVGTCGKTSTTYFFRQMSKMLKVNCGVIGTNGIYINDSYIKSSLTTPDSEDLFAILNTMVENKVKFCIMEVSAHSIFLNKVFSLHFSTLVFTNFSQDHLDFFSTMENYKQVKKSIFSNGAYDSLVINTDDAVGREILNENSSNHRFIGYGIDASIKIINYKLTEHGSYVVIEFNDEKYKVFIPVLCDYNIYNALSVLSVFLIYNYSIDLLIEYVFRLKELPGRFEVIKFSEKHTIIIDYAHTPESTLKTLIMVKKYFPTAYLITVFGCPGNRDQSKRKKTAKICSKFSDFIILTSDNPHYENPVRIFNQIKKGISTKYAVIEDRQLSIEKGIGKMFKSENSVLLILGKGIETYQDINGIFIPFSDKNVVEKCFNAVHKRSKNEIVCKFKHCNID